MFQVHIWTDSHRVISECLILTLMLAVIDVKWEQFAWLKRLRLGTRIKQVTVTRRNVLEFVPLKSPNAFQERSCILVLEVRPEGRLCRGTWVAQSVECLTSAQVIISWFVNLSSTSDSLLSAQSLLWILWSPFSLLLPHSCFHSLFKKKKEEKEREREIIQCHWGLCKVLNRETEREWTELNVFCLPWYGVLLN